MPVLQRNRPILILDLGLLGDAEVVMHSVFQLVTHGNLLTSSFQLPAVISPPCGMKLPTFPVTGGTEPSG